MPLNRREALKRTSLAGLAMVSLPALGIFNPLQGMRQRKIPSSGEALPVVGLGTWQTFDVANTPSALEPLTAVLRILRENGGKVIDSSPMYGRSEAVVGTLTQATGYAGDYFYATKVWTSGRDAGIRQMQTSLQRMQRTSMHLMQIHNLVDWKTHVKTLRDWKEQGKLQYWGITHYLDSAHGALEEIIRTENPDFAQFNYSLRSRHAEKSLFDTCRKHGTAVLINQPYESGSLFGAVRNKALPEWAADFDIHSWGQYFLKFILSNEAVTCVIPGTSKPHHMADNVRAGYGKLPEAAMRDTMVKAIL